MSDPPTRFALGAVLLASLAWPAASEADHVSIEPTVSASVESLTQGSAKVKVNATLTCRGASPGRATYGGTLHLIDIDTGEEIYVGGVFGATDETIQNMERRERDRRMRPRLSNAFCYQIIDGVFHSSGMVEVFGEIVIIPAKGGTGGGGGGGDGGGGGGSGGADPDDPLRPGGCASELVGSAGPDVLDGESGGDLVLALAGADRVRGRDGHDCLVGGSGRDRLFGEEGHDRLTGGSGRDRLDGGPGRNAYDAGSGDDRVKARNGRREVVRCGPGDDIASVDPNDRVRGCETVSRPA